MEPFMVSLRTTLKARLRALERIAFFAESIIAICGQNPNTYGFLGQIKGAVGRRRAIFDMMRA